MLTSVFKCKTNSLIIFIKYLILHFNSYALWFKKNGGRRKGHQDFHIACYSKSVSLYFPISINLFLSHTYINTVYMVPLLSCIIYHVAAVQRLVLISVGSWWYFLPGTRVEGGTGWVLLPELAHPTCTHWPQPLCTTAVTGSVKGEFKLPPIHSLCFKLMVHTSVCLDQRLVVCWGQLICNSFDLCWLMGYLCTLDELQWSDQKKVGRGLSPEEDSNPQQYWKNGT